MAHPNARLTPHGRALLADRIRAGWTITAAARAAGISRQTGSKWWHRAEQGYLSTARARSATRPVSTRPARRAAVRQRRELRVGPHILAWESGLAPSSVYAILRRAGLGRLDRLEPRPAIVRYERDRPAKVVSQMMV